MDFLSFFLFMLLYLQNWTLLMKFLLLFLKGVQLSFLQLFEYQDLKNYLYLYLMLFYLIHHIS
ncbi:hypothetical protein CKO36_17205 [Rhabdochromatium marinum]|nr:hypothetical protein [Rhabdochromatium marinum]